MQASIASTSCALRAASRRSMSSTGMGASLSLQEALDLASLDGVRHDQAVALRIALEHARGRRAARGDRAEEAEQGGAAHVRADRLRRLPGDERQAEERERVEQPALDGGEDLLLAASAREVVLARVALVLARAREGEGLLAAEVVRAALQPQGVAAVLVAAVDARDDAAARVLDAAERVDEGREVLEVHLDQVVDLDPEVVLDGLDGQPGAADRVGGVDLVAAVARDVGEGVARDR